jgi:hypothetical protein
VSKKPEPSPSPDLPDKAKPEDKLIATLKTLLPQNKPVMVTSWVAVVEYMNENGESDLAAFCSNMPVWRLNGIVEAGHDLLVSEYEYVEGEEYGEEE